MTEREADELIEAFPGAPGNFYFFERGDKLYYKHAKMTSKLQQEVRCYFLGWQHGLLQAAPMKKLIDYSEVKL